MRWTPLGEDYNIQLSDYRGVAKGKHGGQNPFFLQIFYKKIPLVPQNDQFPPMDRAKNNKESGGPCPLMNRSKKTGAFYL